MDINANKATTILFILSIVATILNAILPIVPVEYTVYVTFSLGVISEATNALKSGYEDKTVEENADEQISDEDTA